MTAQASEAEGAASTPSTPSTDGLSVVQKEVLAFERQTYKHAAAKEEAIRSHFSLPAARYYQMLNATLDDPAALVYDAMLVKRLLRIRDARTHARSARTLG